MGKLKFKYLPNYKIKLHKKILTHHSTVLILNSQQSKMAPRSPTLCFLVFMTLTSQGQMLPAGPTQASPTQTSHAQSGHSQAGYTQNIDPDTPFIDKEPDKIAIIAGKKALLRLPRQAGHAQADPDTPFFVEEPDNITIIAGKKALLRCVVGNVNGRPVQWTFDNFGLGVDRGLSDYPQLRMVGANPQSKSILICF